jgi:hypothetical protein
MTGWARWATERDVMASPGPARSSRWRLVRVTGSTEESTAAGIYGVIVSAAVMATSHAPSAAGVAAAVFVTLFIYWSAERYARLVAERIHEGRRPSWHHVRLQLTTGWEIVTASALPAGVLVVARLLGVDLSTAVISALVCSTLLLGVAGWEIGRRGRLSFPERLVWAAAAGAFGVALIALKAALH